MGLPYVTFALEPDGKGGWSIIGCGSDGLRAKIFETDDEEMAHRMIKELRGAKALHANMETLRKLVYEVAKLPVTDPSIPADPTLLAEVNRLMRELEGTVPDPATESEEG
jgi:hypothetical protein